MTSYTAGETKAETANLFTLPSDQIAHLQIAPVVKGTLPRVLRLTGSVAYNAFSTTPVFSAVGGPVRDILVTPGDSVRAGQTLRDSGNFPSFIQFQMDWYENGIRSRTSALLKNLSGSSSSGFISSGIGKLLLRWLSSPLRRRRRQVGDRRSARPRKTGAIE